MAKGILHATTPSGHTLWTTFGNTIRMLGIYNYIKLKHNLTDDQIRALIAGDDTLIFIAKKYLRIFHAELARLCEIGDHRG